MLRLCYVVCVIMTPEALVQQLLEHTIRPTAKVVAQPVGKQQHRPRRDDSRKLQTRPPGGEADGDEFSLWLRFGFGLLLLIIVGRVTYTCFMQVRLD